MGRVMGRAGEREPGVLEQNVEERMTGRAEEGGRREERRSE